MVDLKSTKEVPREQFWDVLEDVHAVMLGLENSPQHMQPMAPYPDRERDAVWFLTKKDADLFKELKRTDKARFTLVGPNHDYHASVTGALFENEDRAQIDKMWNQVVSAWFEDGKDDPKLALLEMKLQDAAVWASVGNPIVFGWEIAKAHVKDEEPDVGARAHLAFH
jgi:general stress protein 26